MKALRGSLLALVIVSVSLVTGCATQFSSAELNAPPSPHVPRSAANVEVFASTPPTRPHVDVRILEAVKGSAADQETSVVDDLRAEAGRLGCDAIFMRAVAQAPGVVPTKATATCIMYTDADGAAQVTAGSPAVHETVSGAGGQAVR